MVTTETNKETPCPRLHGDEWTIRQMTQHLTAMFPTEWTLPEYSITLAYGDGFRKVIRRSTVADAVARLCNISDSDFGYGVCVQMMLNGLPSDVGRRAKKDDTIGQIGLWTEIDIHESGDKKKKKQKGDDKEKTKKVPQSREEALAIVRSLPVQPTMIIGSGSDGIHLYYLFDRPIYFRGEFAADQRKAAADREYGWWSTINEAFMAAGYDPLDSVYDIARVLRLAGTRHPKYDNAWAEVISGDGPRCTVEQMDQFRRPAPETSKSTPEPIERVDLPADVRSALDDESTHLGRLWSGIDVPPKDSSMSGRLFAIWVEMVHRGFDDHRVMAAVAREFYEGHWNESKRHKYDNPNNAKDGIANAIDWVCKNPRKSADEEFDTIETTDAPADNATPDAAEKTAPAARRWDDARTIAATITTPIRRYRAKWYAYRAGMWSAVPQDYIDTIAVTAVNAAVDKENRRAEAFAKAMEKSPKLVCYTGGLRATVIDILRASYLLDDAIDAPCWLTGSPCDPADVLPVANGLLNLRTRELMPPTPDYFCLGASPVQYDPAATCPQWLAFLDQVHDGDSQSIGAMQEFFGLTLADDITYQKAALLVGASRGGKGTHVKVLEWLQGMGRVATPQMQHFGGRFGLADVDTAYIAAIQDARLDASKGTAEIVQGLLTWIGGDRISVEAKNQPIRHNVRPRARLIITANAPPNLREESAALINRLIAFKFTKSFADQMDTTLDAKLNSELPGILNWAIDGLHRLRDRGHFVQPARSADLLESIRSATSTVHDYFKEYCTTEPEANGKPAEVSSTALYADYQIQCSATGQTAREASVFGRSLAAYFSGAVTRYRGERDKSGQRPWIYKGLRLLTDAELEARDRAEQQTLMADRAPL